MPRQVRGPDGIVRTFPDDATDAEIATALEASMSSTGGFDPMEGLPPVRKQAVPGAARQDMPRHPNEVMGDVGREALLNTPASALRLAKDTVQGVASLVSGAASVARGEVSPGQALEFVKNVPGAVLKSADRRYGTPNRALRTLRTDPVGALADVSSVTGVGAVAAGTRAPGIARTLATAERVTNPLTLPGVAARGALNKGATQYVAKVLDPLQKAREDFGGTAQDVARAVLEQKVASRGAAHTALESSRRQLTDTLAEAKRTGFPEARRRTQPGTHAPVEGVLVDIVKQELDSPTHSVADLAAARAQAGLPDEFDKVLQRANHLDATGEHSRGQVDVLDAQRIKEALQDSVNYESAGNNRNQVQEALDSATAAGWRKGIEELVPAAGTINKRSQALGGLRDVFGRAEGRNPSLFGATDLVAGTAAVAGAVDPMTAIALAVVKKALSNPNVAARLGIQANQLGHALGDPKTLRAALIAALAGRTEEQ